MPFAESTVSDEFIRLGREMVAKCAGLPLTIIVLGGLLATKERVSDWDTIGGETEIPRTKLIQLWVAEGVVSLQYETKWDEAMEDVAECYLGNLISRCMVQVGQMGSTDARRIDEVRRLAVFLDQHADQLIPQDKQVEGWMERLPAASLFPPQLSKLTLWGCRLVQDPLVTLEKLLNLKFLNGWDMFVGKKMACSPNGFPQLKVLVLRGLPNLDQWTIEDQAMPNLYRLSISDCNNLKTVPDGLKFITSLRELEIRWMPKSFKTRLGTAGEDYHKVQHVPSIVFLN
ncbi:Putative disease resistance RPP8-like protein 4 [Glycine soja]|uniref:Putative disease resistance RPP8-like protein 4 n=1 Tax=Glycine soja TaxID=3848 RepID=A0A0B2Q2I2_GLYSO|nr:Putative disease resistance RPP8-like protein 4 [Glycine soja]